MTRPRFEKLASIIAAVVAAAAMVVGVVAVIVGDGADGSNGAGRLVVPAGATARIDGTSSRRTVGPGDYQLAAGDRVEALQGSSRVELPREGVLEVRAGFRGSDALTPENTTVRVDEVPSLLAGELLVVSDGEPVAIDSAGTVLTVAGAARVARSFSLAVGVYEDDVAIESAGRTVDVAPYRQLAITDLGLVPGRPVPFVYDEQDPWDQRFLGEAIDLTKVLDATARGFSQQLPARAASTADLFSTVFAELAAERAYTQGRPCFALSPGDCLVGLAIALEGGEGTYAERQNEVFAFRGEGAAWGLVVLDQGVERDALLARIGAAIDETPLLFALGGSSSTELPRSGTDTTPPDGGGGSEPPTAPPTTTTTEPDSPLGENPLPPPLEEPTDPAWDLVGDLLESESPTAPLDETLEDPLDDPLSDPLEEPLTDADDLIGQVEGVLNEDSGSGAVTETLG